MSKKYHNPINKPVMVAVPRWEYAALVRASTLLEVVEKIVSTQEGYIVKEVLPALFQEKEAAQDE